VKKKRNQDPKEFKQDAIKLVLNNGIAARKLADDQELPSARACGGERLVSDVVIRSAVKAAVSSARIS